MKKKLLAWRVGLMIASLSILFGSNAAAGGKGQGQSGEIVLRFEFSEGDISFGKYNGYDTVELEGGLIDDKEEGVPAVPSQYVNVLVPAGATVRSVSATANEDLIKSDILILPVQPPLPTSKTPLPFVGPKAEAYASTVKMPAEIARRENTHRMRGWTFVSVRLNPLRYVAKSRELYLAREITVTVTYDAPSARPVAPGGRGKGRFKRMVQGLVVNPTQIGTEPAYSDSETVPTGGAEGAATGACDYMIITSEALASTFQTLANHRAAHDGFSTEVVTIEWISANYDGTRPDGGTDVQTKIRNCIIDYFNNNDTEYVVLGGDDSVVPDRDCYVQASSYSFSDMPCDMYYAGLDGTWDDWDADGVYGEADVGGISNQDEDDFAVDVTVGRIPVRTAGQATDYINKLIAYDTNPPMDIAKKFIMGGKQLWNTYTGSNRPSDKVYDGHMQFQDDNHPSVSDAEMWDRRNYRDYVYANAWDASQIGCIFDTLTSWDTSMGGDYSAGAANMVTRFSEGWNFCTFSTHGATTLWATESGYFNTASAFSLTGPINFVYSPACSTCAFDLADPALCEALLRNANGGSLILVGSGRYGWGGTSWDYMRMWLEAIFGQGIVIAGEAFDWHKAYYAAGSGYYSTTRWLQIGTGLMGDPALRIIGAPQKAIVSIEAIDSLAAEPGMDTGLFKISRDITENDLTVNYSVSGSARNQDYNETLSGSVFMPAGQSTVTITITPTDDRGKESDETVTITISDQVAYRLGSCVSATVTIVDNDTAVKPTVSVTASDANAAEQGSDPGTYTFWRTANAKSDVTVYYSVSGTADNTDYNETLSGSVTIPSGQTTAKITITPFDDSLVEGDETVVLTIASSGSYDVGAPNSATVTIIDNDVGPPVVGIVNPVAGSSVGGTVTIQVNARDNDPAGTLTVGVAIAGGEWYLTSYNAASGYYEILWDTTLYADGSSHMIEAQATDSDTNTAIASPVTVTVNNAGPSTMHVGDLDGTATTVKKNWKATVTTAVHDGSHNPIANATVSGSWSGGYLGSFSVTTDGNGQCTVTSGSMNSSKNSATLTVENVTASGYTYEFADNHDPDGDSDGTAITVYKP